MENYLKKTEQFISELKENPNISHITFEKGIGIKEEDFADYSEEFLLIIAEEVKKFYSEFDGLKVEWKYNPAKQKSTEGYVNILPFYKMVLGNNDTLWENEIWGKQTPDKDLAFYKNLKIFDYFEKDNVHCVCLEVSGKTITPNLWIFREGYEPVPMKINITEYIEKLIYTKGFWGWQYLFTDINLSLDKHEGLLAGIKESIESWSDLFSPETLTKIKKDLDNIIN